MNGSIDIKMIGTGFVKFIRRFHTIIFFLVVSGGLFAAIVMLLGIIALSSTKATTSNQIIDANFDEDTISRLKQSKSEATASGRQNPFSE